MKCKHLNYCSIIFSASNSFNLTSDPHSFASPKTANEKDEVSVMHSNKASYATKALYDEAMKVGQSEF